MPVSVKCPYCNTVFSTTINTQTTCRNRNCRATLHIDNYGKIRRSEPAKRK